jgi:hypothetical protein
VKQLREAAPVERNRGARKSDAPVHEAAAAVAIEAISYIANHPEQMSRFLALTGIDPGAIRAAAGVPGFLAGILDYVCGDERLLVAFAGHAGVSPVEIESARRTLGGGDWERHIP